MTSKLISIDVISGDLLFQNPEVLLNLLGRFSTCCWNLTVGISNTGASCRVHTKFLFQNASFSLRSDLSIQVKVTFVSTKTKLSKGDIFIWPIQPKAKPFNIILIYTYDFIYLFYIYYLWKMLFNARGLV